MKNPANSPSPSQKRVALYPAAALALSLAANVYLGVVGWKTHHARPHSVTPVDQAADSSAEPNHPSQAVGVPGSVSPISSGRAAFVWSEVESTSYADYVANLRRIQCPEETIHDIISADLRATLERRTKNSEVTSAPGARRTQSVDAEVERFTTQLLGSHPTGLGWVSSASIAARPDEAQSTQSRAGMLANNRNIANSRTQPTQLLGTPSVTPHRDGNENQVPGAPGTTSAQDEEPPARDRRSAIADLVRSRYGVDALLGWEREAALAGTSLESFLKSQSIWIPADRLQGIR